MKTPETPQDTKEIRNAAILAAAILIPMLLTRGCVEEALGDSEKVQAIVKQEVDRMHLEHLYDKNGRYMFTQLIFEELNQRGEFEILAWRMTKDKTREEAGQGKFFPFDNFADLTEEQMKEYTALENARMNKDRMYPMKRKGKYSTRFDDHGIPRHVTAGIFKETWSQTDSEMQAREKLPKDHRKGLFNPQRYRGNR